VRTIKLNCHVLSLLLIAVCHVLFLLLIAAGRVLFGLLIDACHKQDSLMRGDLHYKRTSTVIAVNYSTVEIVDNTSPIIDDAKARYWSRIAIFAYSTCIRRPSYRRVLIGTLL